MSDSLYSICRKVQNNDPCTSMVNLNCQSVGNDGCRLLARALRGNDKVVVLFLNQNQLQGQSQAWKELCQAIAQHPALEYLYLSHNPDLKNHGVTLLAQALSQRNRVAVAGNRKAPKTSSKLRVLKLAHCGVGNTGSRSLSWCLQDGDLLHLQTLDLQHNYIGPVGMNALAKSLASPRSSSLHTLDITYSKVPALEKCGGGCNNCCDTGSSSCWWKALENTLDEGNVTLKNLHITRTDETMRSPCQERVQLYLTLNQLGRAHFGEHTLTSAEWTRILGRSSSSLRDETTATTLPSSLLYALIRARLDLVTLSPSPGNGRRPTGSFLKKHLSQPHLSNNRMTEDMVKKLKLACTDKDASAALTSTILSI